MGRNKDKGRKGKSRLNRIISSDLGTPGYTTNAVYSQKVLPDLSVINELKRNLTASKSAEMEVEHELHKKYKVRGLLGNGAFGKVERVEDLESGTTEARKVFDLCGSSTKKKGKNEKSENGIEKKKILAKKLKENQRLRDKVLEELENISQELKVWSELSDCDYIVELFGWEVLERDRIVHIYMESCECSLAHRKLSIPEMKVTLSCILLALNHLHTRNFVHLDLKPDNLLIARNGTVKLCDFGVSVNTKTQLPLEIFDNLRFTPAFVSPEVLWHHLDLQGEKFSNDNAAINYKKAAENLHKCDIWSLGVCLLELAINANPFLVCSQNTLRDKFAAAEKLDELDKADSYVEVLLDDAKNDSFIILPDEADTNMRFTFKTAWKEFIRSKPDYDFMEFVRLCLVIDCELRPDVKELMKDKFVKTSVKTLSVSIDSEDEALQREKSEMLEVMKKFLERNNISKEKDNNRKSVFLKILKFFTQSKMKKSMRSNKNEQLTLLKLGTSL